MVDILFLLLNIKVVPPTVRITDLHTTLLIIHMQLRLCRGYESIAALVDTSVFTAITRFVTLCVDAEEERSAGTIRHLIFVIARNLIYRPCLLPLAGDLIASLRRLPNGPVTSSFVALTNLFHQWTELKPQLKSSSSLYALDCGDLQVKTLLGSSVFPLTMDTVCSVRDGAKVSQMLGMLASAIL